MKVPFCQWNLLSLFGTLNVRAAGLSKRWYLSTKLCGQQVAVFNLRWRISNYKVLKWYMISDWEIILGIQMSMSSLWFVVRLCPYFYKQSMEEVCWIIFDSSWKEALRKTIADRGANGEHSVYNDDNSRERFLTGAVSSNCLMSVL